MLVHPDRIVQDPERRTCTPDPKPEKRIVDPRNLGGGRAKVKAEGKCRCCPRGFEQGWALHPHHLVHRSLGGDDVAPNIVPLCIFHHDAFHHGSGEQREVAGSRIRETLSKAELLYVRGKKGVYFLDRYYPERAW